MRNGASRGKKKNRHIVCSTAHIRNKWHNAGNDHDKSAGETASAVTNQHQLEVACLFL